MPPLLVLTDSQGGSAIRRAVDLVVVLLLVSRLPPSVPLVVVILGLLDASLLGFGWTPDAHHQWEVRFSVTCSIHEHLVSEALESLLFEET